MPWEIAQLNIGRTVAPVDDPRLAGFMERLGEINALAERSPGFVWRLQTESGNATGIKTDPDPLVIINLTVWRSIDELFDFTYRSTHATVFRRRFEWFERWSGPETVLWWQPAGTIPDPADARRRLALLAERGPSPEAFTFKHRFDPPEPDGEPVVGGGSDPDGEGQPRSPLVEDGREA